MAKLIYLTPMSLDGYLGDNKYDWSVPSDASTAFITELIQPLNIYLYGRRIYETMAVWEKPETMGNLGPADLEFARVWKAAKKIVFSKSLEGVSTSNTQLQKNFDADEIRRLKQTSPTDLCVGGATLGATALKMGLVDEIHLLVVPATLGSGISVLPKDLPLHLNLLENRLIGDGWVYLRYQTLPETACQVPRPA